VHDQFTPESVERKISQSAASSPSQKPANKSPSVAFTIPIGVLLPNAPTSIPAIAFLAAPKVSSADCEIFRSTDSGVNWSGTTASFLDDEDMFQLLPLPGGDIQIIQADLLTGLSQYTFTSREYTTAWDSSSTTIVSAINLDNNNERPFGASLYRSTNDIYLCVIQDSNLATSDVLTFFWDDSAGTWTTTAVVNTDGDETRDCTVMIDDNNSDAYVVYTVGANSSDVFFKSSTDDMSTFGSATQLNVTADDIRAIRGNITDDERLFAYWYEDDLDDVWGNTVADLTPSVADPASAAPSFFNRGNSFIRSNSFVR